MMDPFNGYMSFFHAAIPAFLGCRNHESCPSRNCFGLVDKTRQVMFEAGHPRPLSYRERFEGMHQGTMGSTTNSVPMVFIVFSRDSWGL